MRAEILTAIIIASFIFGCIFGIVYETGRRNAIDARKKNHAKDKVH